jgi:hypothetical protein
MIEDRLGHLATNGSAAFEGLHGRTGDEARDGCADEGTAYWDDNRKPADNYRALGKALAVSGDLFRAAGLEGLLLAPAAPGGKPVHIRSASQLTPLLVDRLSIRVVRGRESRDGLIPARHCHVLLRSEAFLGQFRPLDAIAAAPCYLPNLELTRPGYNDGGPGHCVLYTGSPVVSEPEPRAANAFLDVMAFASEADRTNAVAGALTVLLRRLWPGGKPLLAVTSTKSHGGKDTVIQFACGPTPHVAVSFDSTNWALERCVVAALRHRPDVGVVVVENARLGRGTGAIASAFLERFLTDSEPLLYAPGSAAPQPFPNFAVAALSTNDGTIGTDLMNRALPVRLAPVGDVAVRRTPIGNPKEEYLPAHRDRILAELVGMVETWKAAGRPEDAKVRHPFTAWARTVGGILKANGFKSFLANYDVRRTEDDPVRQALGLLGAAAPDAWLRADEWARRSAELGLNSRLIPAADRDGEAARARGMGVVLSAHAAETFRAEAEDVAVTLRLDKRRGRFVPGSEPQTRYRFVVLAREPRPCDPGEG